MSTVFKKRLWSVAYKKCDDFKRSTSTHSSSIYICRKAFIDANLLKQIKTYSFFQTVFATRAWKLGQDNLFRHQ